MVGGGGGGGYGNSYGGGGGGGQVITNVLSSNTSYNLSLSVGIGGDGGSSVNAAKDGDMTKINGDLDITANGGKAGQSTGGGGMGGSGSNGGVLGKSGSKYYGGGGGGQKNGTTTNSGEGFLFNFNNKYYGSGGKPGTNSSCKAGNNAIANTGIGGDGGCDNNNGGNGGSGVVIISWESCLMPAMDIPAPVISLLNFSNPVESKNISITINQPNYIINQNLVNDGVVTLTPIDQRDICNSLPLYYQYSINNSSNFYNCKTKTTTPATINASSMITISDYGELTIAIRSVDSLNNIGPVSNTIKQIIVGLPDAPKVSKSTVESTSTTIKIKPNNLNGCKLFGYQVTCTPTPPNFNGNITTSSSNEYKFTINKLDYVTKYSISVQTIGTFDSSDPKYLTSKANTDVNFTTIGPEAPDVSKTSILANSATLTIKPKNFYDFSIYGYKVTCSPTPNNFNGEIKTTSSDPYKLTINFLNPATSYTITVELIVSYTSSSSQVKYLSSPTSSIDFKTIFIMGTCGDFCKITTGNDAVSKSDGKVCCCKYGGCCGISTISIDGSQTKICG